MQRLVALDTVSGLERFLERAAWAGVDGLELDMTGMAGQEYQLLKEQLLDAGVPVTSVHYDQTRTVPLQDWDAFRGQLDMLAEQAAGFGADTISVHPPLVDREDAHTVKDLQEFMAQVDAYAADCEHRICLALTGFLTDPELMNAGFAALDDPSVGVMVDVGALVDGVDPATIMAKLDVDIVKIRVPLSLREMDQELDLEQDVIAVAEHISH